jgi:hypothetical protein
MEENGVGKDASKVRENEIFMNQAAVVAQGRSPTLAK